jgi:hypothetical protein
MYIYIYYYMYVYIYIGIYIYTYVRHVLAVDANLAYHTSDPAGEQASAQECVENGSRNSKEPLMHRMLHKHWKWYRHQQRNDSIPNIRNNNHSYINMYVYTYVCVCVCVCVYKVKFMYI